MWSGKVNVTEKQLKYNILKNHVSTKQKNPEIVFIHSLLDFLLPFTYSQLDFATLVVRAAMVLHKGYDETAN